MIYKLFKIQLDNTLNNNVITVGKIKAIPNNSNVIASNMEFFIDVRDVDYDDKEIALSKESIN